MSNNLVVALPKGRLSEKIYKLFKRTGYECPEIESDSRKLIFVNDEKGISFVLVKPSDVGIYVERGAADIGIVGKDTLMESCPDVYELLDMNKGVCRLCVAAKRGWRDSGQGVLRVATKYPNIAKGYFAKKSRRIEIIKLSGSIELAPLLGLSDVIFDIVETGATLKENDLVVTEEAAYSSARLVANKSSFHFRHEEITALCNKLKEEINSEMLRK